ncbi:MAG: glycosyltransferase family 4 protein [Candidatus Cloacimonadia bacterium]|jgi:glycosyltransferase involved in cell wall biosynthesis
MPRILLIAYYYPPLGGPASLRLSKTAHYLSKLGWNVDVLTVKNILYHSIDEGLVKREKGIRIFRTNSLEVLTLLYYVQRLTKLLPNKEIKKQSHQTSNLYFKFSGKLRDFGKKLFFPDEKIGWLPYAYKRGAKLLQNNRYDLILASSGPYTSALIAHKLSKAYNVPYVIDYRDHWSLNPYETQTGLHHRLSKQMEREILKDSAKITTIGQTMKDELIEAYPFLNPNKIGVIYNGYDETDFSLPDKENSDRTTVTFSYLGNLYGQRSPKYFLRALKELNDSKRLPSNIRVKFIGNYHIDTLRQLQDESLGSIVEIVPQVPHKEAIRIMLDSDVLLLFIPTKDGKGVLTSKVFEYLRSGKPTLAMIPQNSELHQIIEEIEECYTVKMEDLEGIREGILTLYDRVLNKPELAYLYNEKIAKYSRERQTEKLNELLLNII